MFPRAVAAPRGEAPSAWYVEVLGVAVEVERGQLERRLALHQGGERLVESDDVFQRLLRLALAHSEGLDFGRAICGGEGLLFAAGLGVGTGGARMNLVWQARRSSWKPQSLARARACAVALPVFSAALWRYHSCRLRRLGSCCILCASRCDDG